MSLWLNLSGDPDIPRITVSSSEECWRLFIFNEEGVAKMTDFVESLYDEVVREALLTFIENLVEVQQQVAVSGGAGSSGQPIVLMSSKDNEKLATKLYLKNLVGVISSWNPSIVDTVDAASVRGSVTLASAPVTLVSRLAAVLGLENSGMRAAKGSLLWFTLTARHSNLLVTPVSSSASEGVTLSDFSEDAAANMTTATGIASLFDSYFRMIKRFAGNDGSYYYHVLAVVGHDFTTSLRNTSSDKGALGCLHVGYLQELALKIWVNLGLLYEDQARLDHGLLDESNSAFEEALKVLFAIDASDLEHDVARWYRSNNKRKRDESDAAKVAANIVKKLGVVGSNAGRGSVQIGGGGGRGRGGRTVAIPRVPQHNQGRGRVSIVGRVNVQQEACIANLQHLLEGQPVCQRGPACHFSHVATMNLVDRAAAKVTATRVVTNQGSLATLMAKLNDVGIKFLGE